MSELLGSHPLGPFGAYTYWLVELTVAVGVVAFFALLGVRRIDRFAEACIARSVAAKGRRLAAVIVAGVLVVCLATAALVLQRFPNSADEYGDLFQAETFSEGRLWNAVPEHAEFFSVIHIAEKDGKWVARYPPGWPALLALAGTVRFPTWALNPLLAALTLALGYRFANRFIGPAAGPIAAVLMAAASFFVFTAASYRSHVSASLWILAAAYLLARYVEESRTRHAILAGVVFGLAFATRPFTALLCALPFLGYLLATQRTQALRPLAYVALGAVPGITGLLLVNYFTTGDPLVLVTTWMDPSEGLGFTKGHTVSRGVMHTLRRLGAFVEWTNPALLFVFVSCSIRLWSERTRGLFAWMSLVLPALILGHFIYHAFGGTQYGPRFYYEAYPFVVLVAVHGMVEFTRGHPPLWPRRALLAGLVFAVVTLPFAAVRLHGVVSERKDVFDLVRRHDVHNAVVFIANPTSSTWPMPVQDLVRNGTWIGDDVIYAHSLGDRDLVLKAAFPERIYYRYERDETSPYGRLEPYR